MLHDVTSATRQQVIISCDTEHSFSTALKTNELLYVTFTKGLLPLILVLTIHYENWCQTYGILQLFQSKRNRKDKQKLLHMMLIIIIIIIMVTETPPGFYFNSDPD